MFILFIILLLISIVISVKVYLEERDCLCSIVVIFISLAVLLLPFFATFRWQISDSTYTGYIYSRESKFGYTTYEIRYSLNAGEDNQPSFSVESDSEQETKLDALIGSNEKVTIKVESGYPHFVNNPFEPSALAELVE